MMRKLFLTLSILLVGCGGKETDATTVEIDKSAVLQASLDTALAEVQILKNTNAALNKENGALSVKYNNATNTISVLSEEIDLLKAQGQNPPQNAANAEVVRLNQVIEQQKNFIMQLRKQQTAAPKQAAAPVKNTYMTRQAFEQRFLKKSKGVIMAWKKPDSTSGKYEGSSNKVIDFWTYEDITYDPITNKIDYRARLTFHNGYLNGVSYGVSERKITP